MQANRVLKPALAFAMVALLASCGGNLNPFKRVNLPPADSSNKPHLKEDVVLDKNRTTIWDAFKPNSADVTVKVNKYIWNASLEVLDFLPVTSVDPFSGVIVTGYGTPPGGGRAYRATIYVRDPALDARSLHVAMQTRGGRPVAAGTVKAIEDAILTRARELRIADGKF